VRTTHPGSGRIEPGQRLDRYELLCPIAEGGMASVWLARLEGKHGFEKLVAIKTILPKYASDEAFQKMLLDEARIASCIEHVNVAQILDLGEEHDTLYLVLEWVEGDSLSRLARAVKKSGQQLPPGIILRIVADACGGLHAAHELRGTDGRLLGVVHRDVSPQNILVSTSGMAKVIDFGIAKARDRLVGETSAGVLKGKVRYMAPEQALGRPTDRRADVWALGAVLYRLITGRAPFEGENELASLNLLASGRPPPPLPPAVHPSIRAVVKRALSHDLDARFATAGEMQADLEQAMVDAGLVTTTSNVAAFAAVHLAPYMDKRREAVQVALAAAAERQRMRALMQPMVFPEVSTDVSRIKPELPSEPTLPDGDDAVTVHLAQTPAPAATRPAHAAMLRRPEPPAQPEPPEVPSIRTDPPVLTHGASMRIPVSGLSMRTIMIAACGVLTTLAVVLLLTMHQSSHPTGAAARPPEVARQPRAAIVIPPPPAASAAWSVAEPPVAAPVATPEAAPTASPIAAIAATDLPRAPAADTGARPRPPATAPPVATPPVATPPVASATVEAPKPAVARRVDDGF
jgi:serine/threonine-protein kinase